MNLVSSEKPTARQLATRYGSDNLNGQPLEYYLAEYEKADPIQISNRLGIPYDLRTREFTLSVFGERYSIRHPDFANRREEDESTGVNILENVHMQILLLRYLLYASIFPHNGEFKSYRELPSGELYYRQFTGRCISRLTRAYGARPDVFQRTMRALCAIPIHSDGIGYELETFDSLYLRLILWEQDEEFPAASQILFSSNLPAAFSAYDLVELVEITLWMMREIEKAAE